MGARLKLRLRLRFALRSVGVNVGNVDFNVDKSTNLFSTPSVRHSHLKSSGITLNNIVSANGGFGYEYDSDAKIVPNYSSEPIKSFTSINSFSVNSASGSQSVVWRGQSIIHVMLPL
jgi:hypothetical protein